MKPYNTSVSPPSDARQSFLRFGHADRDKIKRRAEADFPKLYADHGGRCRGKVLYCIFHEDQTPSASFYKGRFRCFTCNISLDVIEFVMRAQGTDFKGALTYLSDRYGVPLQSWRLPPADRAKYAQQQRDLERDLPAARCWRRAAILVTDIHLDELKSPLADPTRGPTDWKEILAVEQQLARLRRLDGLPLVGEYHSCRAKNPLLASALVRFAARLELIDECALDAYWDSMETDAQ